MMKISPKGFLSSLKINMKNPSIVESVNNTVEAIRIIRNRTPEEINKIIFSEGHPSNKGNTGLVATLNKLMSKEFAEIVYKNV